MAGLADMPCLHRLGTWMGHDTVNEEHVVDTETLLAGKGGKDRTSTCIMYDQHGIVVAVCCCYPRYV